MSYLTAEAVELINTQLEQPENGAKVLALTRGGKLVEAVWRHNSKLEYDAWCHYPKIPADVKAIQSARYK